MNFSNLGKNKLQSIIKDPFLRRNIIGIRVQEAKSIFSDVFCSTGHVDFKIGNTKGTQDFKGDSFDDVVIQIRNFLNTLK